MAPVPVRAGSILIVSSTLSGVSLVPKCGSVVGLVTAKLTTRSSTVEFAPAAVGSALSETLYERVCSIPVSPEIADAGSLIRHDRDPSPAKISPPVDAVCVMVIGLAKPVKSSVIEAASRPAVPRSSTILSSSA